MRITSAWFLLLISLFSWIGGNLFFEVTYFKERGHQMNKSEQYLAKELNLEMGANVKMLDKSEMTPDKIGYTDYLGFSAEIDSRTFFFTLVYDYNKEVQKKVVVKKKIPIQDPEKTALLKSLFKEFMFPVPYVPDITIPAFSKSTFCYTGRQTQYTPAVPNPPPDLA